MGIPICGECRRPIEERIVTALGKHWHVEHFVCAKCEKPFHGHRHYEKKGLAYCEQHYHQLTRSKFYEYDERPACRRCYERFPSELRRRLRRAHHYTVRR
ncbi:Steamer duck [Operophtera brumata]|uniref:Steamer duck n=1 Tax=Operophtera brumata TaxID=104452 RepID=A0A0L7KZ12_OPEBR|nr:Steamer duck [Operophtera brumata]